MVLSMRKTSLFFIVFAVVLMGFASFSMAYAIESYVIVNGLINFSIFGWLALAFIEEGLKFPFVRKMKLTFALLFIMVFFLTETIFIALVADFYHGLGHILSDYFWYIILLRLVYNGHIYFFGLAFFVTWATNHFLKWKWLIRTGTTVNVMGLVAGGALHFLWNWSIIFKEPLYFLVAVILGAAYLGIILYFHDDMKEIWEQDE
jgi:hypothetical protein